MHPSHLLTSTTLVDINETNLPSISSQLWGISNAPRVDINDNQLSNPTISPFGIDGNTNIDGNTHTPILMLPL
jgi:hypothetical protein